MKILEKFVLIAILLVFSAITVWLEQQSDQPEEVEAEAKEVNKDPDYYMENFVASGIDSKGRQYSMDALRLAHFPHDGTSLVDQPHIIQYEEGKGPRHVYAESGLISADGTEVLLTGNVKIIESHSDGSPGNLTTTDRMRIKLKKKPGT